ncbi:hypothetical protein [uncultured Dysosmobacter sp.]|uniref:hypothetical protein n=1 Tax=uncultured Dysosmobacter sp. TaxID=2591384 RepID=UPI002606771D|nr:hypothetical protein [uncultured Dysosmobacter sp.]
MDDLWDCLYTYVQENCVPRHLHTSEHRRASASRESALSALETMLSPEQQAALEQFLLAEAGLYALETMALFQETFALGKWMAR